MYYQDIAISQFSRLQNPIILKQKIENPNKPQKNQIVNTSSGLEDSGEYINTSRTYKIHQQQNQKYLNQKTMIQIIIATIIITILCMYIPNQENRKQLNSKQNENNLYVISEAGYKFQLAYKKPIIIKPQTVAQNNNNGLIQISDTDQFIKYVDSLGNATSFSQKLFLNWFNQDQKLFQAQFYRFNKKYDLMTAIPETPLCVVSPFRNIISSSQSWYLFLKSIHSQNYSNYKIFMIDDLSTDGSNQQVLKQAKLKYPKFNNRLTIIKNVVKRGALGNRDVTIRNQCKPGDIIIDMDADDSLIGKQVFNLVNRLYKKDTQPWFIYNNYLAVAGRTKGQRNANLAEKMRTGVGKAINPQTFAQNSYRVNLKQWVTSQLRTYLRDLYVKIPLSHLIEPGTRQYYLHASDRFSMYALAQLAGKNHTLFVEEYVYFYFQPNFLILQQKQCTLPSIFYSEAQARILTPLIPLSSLNKPAQVTKNYAVNPDILLYYLRAEEQYLQCLQKIQKKKQNSKKNIHP